jgi:uncharacterized protein (DUF305 family)
MKNQLLTVTAFLISASLTFSCGTKKTATNEMENMAHTDSTNSGSMPISPQHSGMDNDMMRSMSSTMSKMKDMKMTGDFDADFASMMIMHHQGAIAMSEVEIDKGANTQIKTMAQNIIREQKAEIEKLEKFVSSYNAQEVKQKKNDLLSKELDVTMNTMMNKMTTIQMTGNADKDFVMMMIPHHEGAKTMAEQQVKHGRNAELKNMAQKMITEQTKEIVELKAWQAAQK